MVHRFFTVSLGVCALFAAPAFAADVNITDDMATYEVSINGTTIRIARDPDTEARIDDEFAKTSRPCPPFCIQPMEVRSGVETVGELELLDFLDTRVASGRGLLIDSRVPQWFEKGTIPGAVNVPFNTLDPENPYRDDILQALGARRAGGGWDFSGALDLMMFCNGPWCEQSPRAIGNLIDAGYPPAKLHYYRGGMQLWLLLGLTVKQPV